MVTFTRQDAVWRFSTVGWLIIGLILALIGIAFFQGIGEMVKLWDKREEYSHGYMIPVITLFLIWQKKELLEKKEFSGSWYGFWVCAIGLSVFLLGEVSTIAAIVQYALLIVIFGLLLALLGKDGFKLLWVPLVYLAFMIPLPPLIFFKLSGALQLVSSELGVAIIRLLGISVFLEGNVIDLGEYKLQVVEACSGLRYLFPLMSFGFVFAYYFKAPLWLKAALFLSTIPITVLMNSFRIGVIGVMVEYWGEGMADGFLHDFEGWVIFMACTAILVGEIWAFKFFCRQNVSFLQVLYVDLPVPPPSNATISYRKIHHGWISIIILLVITNIGLLGYEKRSEVIPDRRLFTDFPLSIGEWSGQKDRLEDIYLEALDLTDYFIGDFHSPAGESVNLYSAYYHSQKKRGQAIHSPRSCLPGGGWEIKEMKQMDITSLSSNDPLLTVNRVKIQYDDNRQLVYYWFKQRGRDIASEYMVKWYLFWDSLTRHRTDGALVRVITPVGPNEEWSDGDERLSDFVRESAPVLDRYIPR